MARILLLAVGGYLAFVLYKSFKDLDVPAQRRAKNWTLFATCAAIAIAVLARFGLHWLGAIGAASWALARGVGPTIWRTLHSERPRPASAPADPPKADPPADSKKMSRGEALEVLGLNEGASREQIVSAYRTLIRKVHPDAPGGSTYFATKLNQARDVLLG